MHSLPGKYVVIDGMDRVGKGTLINTIKDFELSRGKRIFDADQFQDVHNRLPSPEDFKHYDIIVLSEPTYTDFGKEIREILIRKGFSIPSLNIANAYSEDRKILLKKVILPALQQNKIVLSSRSVCSSLIYQPIDANEKNESLSVNTVMNLPGNIFALNNTPNLLIIPTIDSVSLALERSQDRNKDDDCKFEVQSFQELVKKAYESDWLRIIYESRGTKVKYVDTSRTLEDSKRNILKVWTEYFYSHSRTSNLK